MYDFHYNKFLTKCPDSKVLFTDTGQSLYYLFISSNGPAKLSSIYVVFFCHYLDSLCYHVTCPDIYEIMHDSMDWYDTSNYPDDNRHLKSDANKKVLGKMKDEMAGQITTSFVGLRPKMYSLMTFDNVNKLTAKGVAKCYTKKHLRHEMYLRTLKNKTISHASSRQFKSINHKQYTVKISKVALSAFDNKRFILPCGVKSVPYGHCKIGIDYF